MPTMVLTYNTYMNTDCARTEKAIIYFLLLNTERVLRFTLLYIRRENLTQYVFPISLAVTCEWRLSRDRIGCRVNM